MNIQQKEISLQSRRQGIYLITDEVVAQLPELRQCKAGFLHLFMLHTSASLSINENADPTVRHDMHRHLHELVPENAPYYKHTLEGADDMPAHIKATITDTSSDYTRAARAAMAGHLAGYLPVRAPLPCRQP